ncbi:MAG: ATP-binding protein [Candidatus Thermoplasmatota archaeon]
MRSRSLQTRILAPLAWALLPALILLGSASVVQWNDDRAAVSQSLEDGAQRAGAAQQTVVARARDDTFALALWASHTPDARSCSAVLRAITDGNLYQNAGVVDAQGDVVCVLDTSLIPRNLRYRDSWQQLQMSLGFVVADYEYSPDATTQSVAFLNAVVNETGFAGAAFVLVSPGALASALAQEPSLHEARVILVDAQGIIIAGDLSVQELIGVSLHGSDVIDALEQGRTGYLHDAGLVPGESRAWYLDTVDGTEAHPVRFAVGLDIASAYAAANGLLIVNLAFAAGLVGLVSLVAGVALHRYVVRHVKALAKDAERPLGEPAPATPPLAVGAREIDRLAQSAWEARVRVQAELTERARTQENLERTNRELEQFAYIASHDLQEPLRKVISFNELLRDESAGRLDELGRHYLERSIAAAQRMQILVREILAYSRLEKDPLDGRVVETEQIVDQVLLDLQAHLAAASARVERNPLPDVRGNPVQIGRLFQNLVDNAVKYRDPTRAPLVRIGTRATPQGPAFFVEDNGIGIAPEHHGKLFQIFQRLHSRAEIAGTGIGLAACKKIVERSGGRIWIESKPGHGSTFLFTLPLNSTQPAPTT